MDTILLGLVIVLGIAVGLALNYLGDWLPIQRGIAMQTGWQRPRFLLVVAATAATAVWLWLNPHANLGFWPSLLLLAYFGLIVIIDIEHKLILYPTVWFGLALNALYGIYLHGWLSTLLGGLAGFAIMLVLYFFGDFIAKHMARMRNEELDEVALGFGDVNLAAIIGLLLGWPGILAGLVLAIFAGGVISILYVITTMILRRYNVFAALPYGPYLVFGAVALLFFRNAFLNGL